MGENSPWLTLFEGSDSGRPSRSTLFRIGRPWHQFVSLVFPGPEALRASSADRHHQFGTPVSSPWHDLGEPVGYIVIRSPVLEFASCFVSTPYGDKPDGRRGRARQGICTRGAGGTTGVTLFFLTMRLR